MIRRHRPELQSNDRKLEAYATVGSGPAAGGPLAMPQSLGYNTLPVMQTPKVSIYDTTLRDGTQGEGISFSVLDKIRVAEKLDAFGVHYIEGGWPGSNPKDIAFFKEAARKTWRNAKITAFGSTRRANLKVDDDPQIRTLLDAQTPVVTMVGKSWLLHVTEVLGVQPGENFALIGDSVAFCKKQGREVIYDGEHFFDGYKDDPQYALDTLKAARDAGADIVVLCDTNGGSMPDEIYEIASRVVSELGVKIGIHSHSIYCNG